MHRSGLGIVCLLIVGFGCAEKPDPAVIAAAEQIQKLGGTFILHGATVPIKPGVPLPKGNLSVRQIDLNGKKVRDKQLEALKPLKQVEELHLEGSFLTDVGMSHLQDFKQLQELDLHKSLYITDKGLESLKYLPKLSKLELSYTRITDKGLEHVNAIRGLKVLHLTGTRVTEEGLKVIKAGLPGCEVLK
ncbi:MAG: hypothetical protein JWN70_6841 [Planctomycetaceae bacterium]|nr:hypothetical protein [Planctomycetaceae bacterium]